MSGACAGITNGTAGLSFHERHVAMHLVHASLCWPPHQQHQHAIRRLITYPDSTAPQQQMSALHLRHPLGSH